MASSGLGEEQAAKKMKMETLEGVFKKLAENVDIVSKQIKGGQGGKDHSDSFSPQVYWPGVDNIFQILSKETTKLSLAFSKKPFPSPANTQTMVVELEKAMLALTSIFYTLPLSQGKCLRRSFRWAVVKVLESIYSFALALLETVTSPKTSQRLIWTGGVWESTGFIVDKDNKSCVLQELTSTDGLVQDALGELNEAKESDGQMGSMLLDDDEGEDEGPAWTEQDKRVVAACEGLVKATRKVVKKCKEKVTQASIENNPTNTGIEAINNTADDIAKVDITNDSTMSTSDNGENKSGESAAAVVSPSPMISLIDDLVELTSRVSEMVDLTVSCIYAPINYMEIKENSQQLTDLMLQILQFLRASELTNNQDTTWLDFLNTALEHNLEKIRKTTLPDQGHG